MHESPLSALDGAIDLWRVDLREVGMQPLRSLTLKERERAAKIANPARRALWMRGRGVLRVLLGGYLRCPPGEIELVTGAHGKPALAASPPGVVEPTGARSPHFNLSHSGPLALYAFTAATPVGVDLELARAREHALDEPALAERVFGAQVAERLRGLDAPARRVEFLALWVRHEAGLKCLGLGLGLGAGEEWPGASSAGLWVADLALGAGAAGALAVAGEALKLRMRKAQLRRSCVLFT